MTDIQVSQKLTLSYARVNLQKGVFQQTTKEEIAHDGQFLILSKCFHIQFIYQTELQVCLHCSTKFFKSCLQNTFAQEASVFRVITIP